MKRKTAFNLKIAEPIVIDGVDVEFGIARTGGTAAAYLGTLSVFLGDGREKADEMKKCLEAGNLTLFTIKAHALKGAAASIGAAALAENAMALEMAGKREDRAFIEENSGRLFAELESLLRDIDRIVESERKKLNQTGIDREALKAILVDLNAAIDNLDPDAINAAAGELRRLWIAADAGGDIGDILHRTLTGDHDGAISMIEELLRRKN